MGRSNKVKKPKKEVYHVGMCLRGQTCRIAFFITKVLRQRSLQKHASFQWKVQKMKSTTERRKARKRKRNRLQNGYIFIDSCSSSRLYRVVGILCEGCLVLVRSRFFFTEPITSGPTMTLMPIGTPFLLLILYLYAHSLL
jgi:hypothetical protein